MIKTVNNLVSLLLIHLGYKPDDIELIITQIENGIDVEDINEIKVDDKCKFKTVSCLNPISPQNHIWMVSAIQPNISGGISKTINIPNDYTEDQIKDLFKFAWVIGCKCITVYRDGSKAIQPLSSTSVKKEKKKCPVCGSSNISNSGSCGYCKDCGASTGCS